jgi:hypothetical protein
VADVTPGEDAMLEAQIQQCMVGTRTLSAALIAWFLEAVWRVDAEEVDSAICDGGGDKGIDALLVDEDAAEITILQSKHRANPGSTTQGDKDLKDLVGASEWFKSPESVDALLSAGPNPELKKLLHRQHVRDLIASGDYSVRLVFITNASLDVAGSDYVSARQGEPVLTVWDRERLIKAAKRTRRPDLRVERIELVCSSPPIVVDLTGNETMVIGVIPAKELLELPGIEDRTLFSRNVRLFAGRTRINRELTQTVNALEEHRLFPAYHNGLTLLTNGLRVEGNSIHLEGVGVVNGCQSLVTLFDNSFAVTDELQLLVKVVETRSNDRVADLITYRSNNQNAVTLRDQRSSDTVMRDLQAGVHEVFGSSFGLRIRVGEEIGADAVMENATAAQLIMAAYLQEPWAAVRKVRLFDQDYRRIFNRHVTPERLWLLHIIESAVIKSRGQLRADLRASFASVKFTLVYLVAQVLRLSKAGELLLERPEDWIPKETEKVAAAIERIAIEVVDGVNYHVKDALSGDENYDPKVAFKSKTGVSRLETDVHRDARRQADRSSSYLFTVTPAVSPD